MKKHLDWYLPDDETHFCQYITKRGYQSYHREYALSFVKEFRNAIDIGANVGLFSKPLSKSFKHVYCFEPAKKNLECWYENTKGINNLTMNECGLGNHQHKVSIDITPTACGCTKVNETEGDINILTLDSFGLTDISFIKVDTEGYEYKVMEGAKETLANNNPIIQLELPRKTKKDLEEYNRTILLMYGLGYKKIGEYIKEIIFSKM